MMDEKKIISGDTFDEVWQQVSLDLGDTQNILEYSVIIEQQNRKVLLDIDIDPGGGFESGDQSTVLQSLVPHSGNFKFAIHHQGFIDGIGKFFGMQDVVIGFPEFDSKVIVKTNDEQKVIVIFAGENVRQIFQNLTDFNFHVTHLNNPDTHEQNNFLELYINEGITDPEYLGKVYKAFYSVLILLEAL